MAELTEKINKLEFKHTTTSWNKNLERKQRALEHGKAFVKSIMENEYESIPNSDGMSVLRNVVMLEIGKPRMWSCETLLFHSGSNVSTLSIHP